jgi:hypothetical protein
MPGWDQVSVLLLHGGKIYGGTGTYGLDAHLFVYDPAASPGDEVTDLGVPVPGEDYLYSLAAPGDGYLYGGTGWDGHFFVYDLVSGTFDDLGWDAPGEGVYALVPGPDGLIYGGSRSGFFFSFDPVGRKFTDLGQPSPGEYYVRSLAVGADGRIYGGTGSGRGWLFAYDPASGEMTHFGRAVWGTNTIRALISSDDGTLYGAGVELFALDVADPAYGSSGQAASVGVIPAATDLGMTPFTPDVYTLAWHDGILYGGGYSGYLLYLDPYLGLPLQLGKPVPDENRITSLASAADGKLYGGTGGWSWASGHLFSYDPVAHLSQDLGTIVPAGEYEISALALAGDQVYAGSGSNAHLIVYDIGTGTPADKGQVVAGEYSIDGLAVGPDGRVYGLTAPLGYLFAYDPVGDGITILWVYPGPDTGYWYSPITVGADGLLYFSVGPEGRLYALDPVTEEVSDRGRPVSEATAITALQPFGEELYGAANVDAYGETRTILFVTHPASGETRVIGQPLPQEPRITCLATAGDLVYGGTGWGDGHFFAYDTALEFEWGRLILTTTLPLATQLRVDVRGQDGTVLVEDAIPGQSLAAIDARQYPSLELFAELTSSDPSQTPAIEAWGISWPPIRVTPSEILVLANPDDPDVVTRTVTLRPTAGVPVTWTAQLEAPWLALDPLSGTVPATVTLAVDKAGLAAGAYTATVPVVWAAPDETGREPIRVTLKVGDYPSIYLPLVVRGR